MIWRRFALIAAVAIGVLVPAGAGMAEPESIDIPETATYGAETISTSDAVDLGLSCVFDGATLECFDSEKEVTGTLTSASFAPEGSGGAVAAASCTPGMTLYDGTSFTGANVTITVQSVWVNLGNLGFNNRTSSWRSGCVGGYLANGTGGSGSTVGLPAGGQQASMGSFNNLASSAKRCPC